MNFSVVDAGGVLLATAAGGVVVAWPGFALARLFNFLRSETRPDALTGVVVGLAVLPGITSLLTRIAGLDAALTVTLALAALAVGLAAKDRAIPKISALGAGLVALVLAILVVEWIDIDAGTRLWQPLTVVDTVKHAATTQAILDSGAPPRDAFFLRPERSSYYYYFYTMTALIQRLCFGLADARAAVGGMVFWTAVGLFGLVRLAMDRAGVTAPNAGAKLPLLIIAVLAAGGLDVVAVFIMAFRDGYWMADPMQWNEQVSIWVESLLWVPHHVTALIAGIVGLIALADLVVGPSAKPARLARNILLAALCFSSALGLSVWVTMGLVASTGVWCLLLIVERRWRALAYVGVAGVLAILIAAPLIIDLHTGRAGPLPIAGEIRMFTPVDRLIPDGPWRSIARLVALPLNYAIEFGVLAFGTLLYWRRRSSEAQPVPEFGRVLLISAVVCLAIGASFRSLIFNNDLGWRIMLFPLLAGTVWTIGALDDMIGRAKAPVMPAWRAAPIALVTLLALGWGTSLSTLVSIRAYPLLPLNPMARFVASDPATERALRVAYGWADANLPKAAVLQHNPTRRRALAFALYGHNPTALSDRYGSLYGADFDAVSHRLETLGPIFTQVLPDAAVQAIARQDGIEDLVVTAADPVWSQPDSFVWQAKPLYQSDRVRIIPVAALGGPTS